MVKVEVLIDNFKDIENYHNEIKVIRNGKEIVAKEQLLHTGDIYEISKERYNHLSIKGIVAKFIDKSKVEEGE